MKNVTKNDCMDFHVLKRFRQRFRVIFCRKDIDNIVKSIVEGKTEGIYQLSNSKRIHIVEYNGLSFGCVYNKLRKRIHTVFPVDWIEDGKLEEHLLKREDIEEVEVKRKHPVTIPLQSKNKRICLTHF